MIPLTFNILALPVVLTLWALDTYLFLATTRLILRHFTTPAANRYGSVLGQLTDGVPRLVDSLLCRWRQRPSPSWLPWLIVLGTGVVIRQILVSTIIGMSVRGA